jgi:hypothetical protein
MTICHGPGLAQAVLARMSGTPARPVTSFENQLAARLATLARPLLETRELMRIPRALALFMLAFLALPSVAAAQTTLAPGGITIFRERVTLDGDTIRSNADDDFLLRGYNEAECDDAASVATVFRVTNIPSNITLLDAWIGDNTVDCSTTEARQTGMGRTCVHLTGVDPNVIAPAADVTLTLEEMLDPDETRAACNLSTATGVTQRLWFFALGSTETTAAVTAAQYGHIEFTIDPNAPATPAPNQTMVSGDETISVSWDIGAEQNLRYNVYVDTSAGACSGGDAGMGMPGNLPPTREGLTTNSVGLSTSSLGLTVGQSALVYVSAVDRADNESDPSSAVCITRVETVGFCDALEDGGEACTNTCAATLPGTRSASGALLFGLAGLALVVRRRTRS